MSQTLSGGQNCFPSVDVEFVWGSLSVTVKSTNSWLAQTFQYTHQRTTVWELFFALE